jgi:hypothetical protein
MPDGKPVAFNSVNQSVIATPLVANGVLYIASRRVLFAIAAKHP